MSVGAPAHCDVLPHPITTEGRAQRPVVVAPGTTLDELVGAAWPAPGPLPPLVWVDGRAVGPEVWPELALRGGECVTLRAALAGDDTDPLRTALQIAIIVAAIYVPGASWLGLAEGAHAYASAAILIGGNLVVDAIAPPRLPDAAGGAGGPDPVHALTGTRNRARPYEPLPLVLGTHRIAPDLGAAQYTEFDGGDQYLYATFNFGLGTLSWAAASLKIGDTPLSAFDGEAETATTAAAIRDLVAGNVDTVAGGEVTSATEWIVRQASAGATRLALDLVGRVVRLRDDGGTQEHTVTLDVQIRAVHAGGARTIDYQAPLTGSDSTPARRTARIELPTDDPQPADGRWEVRVKRRTAPSDNRQIFDDVSWQALRSYQPDDAAYAGQTRLGVKLRASGRLSGALDTLTAVVSQQIPTWDPALANGAGAWTEPMASSNPAWIFRWFAAGVRDAGGRLVAGAGLPESRIDDASIRRWGAWCDAQQLTCSYVVQSAMSVHDVLDLIAQTGRAAPTWAGGRLGVVWEAADQTPVTLITPGNILAGTCAVDWAGGQAVDEVVCRYIDGTTWESNVVRRVRAGVATPASTVTLTLQGVTSARQAAMEANLTLARQRYQRRRIHWRMDLAGLSLLARGDVVWITHALLDGGEAGRLWRLDGTTLDLDRAITAAAGDHLLLALPDGRLHATTLAAAAEDTQRVRIADAVPAPAAGEPPFEAADLLWRWYAPDEPPVQARIVSLEPDVDSVLVTAVDEVAAYHAAATSDLTVPATSPADAVSVVSLYAWTVALPASQGDVAQVHVLAEVSGPWIGGVVDVTGAAEHSGQMGPAERTHAWTAPRTGTVTITVIPVGAPDGALSLEYAIDGPSALPPPFDWRGAWAAGTYYERNDAVSYQGRSYICVTAHTSAAGNAPSGTNVANTWWDVLSRPGLDGEDGAGLEEVFAVTNLLSLSAGKRPLDTWPYDPSTPHAARGGVSWTDGAALDDLDADSPILWRCGRTVPGIPARGATPPATGAWPRAGWGQWSQPRIVGRYGADGEDGDDGQDGGGEERIYALTGSGTSAIPTRWRPDDAWSFDSPARAGTPPSTLLWYDAPPSVTAMRPRRWISTRRVPGTPSQADRPPSGLPALPATKNGWSRWSLPTIDGDSHYATPETVDTAGHCHQIGRLLICWGTRSRLAAGARFDVSFPTTAYAAAPRVWLQQRSSRDGTLEGPSVGITTTSGFYAWAGEGGWIDWMSIGYTAA